MSVTQYWQIIRDAVREDRRDQRERKRSLQPEFLPAALEVIERPVSPTGRLTAWLLTLILVATLAWLVIGRVDVVASAIGRIKPSGSVKIVQAPGSGIVTAIHVSDGDFVKKGQLLLEFDTTVSTANLDQARKALMAADLEVARNQTILDGLAGRPIHFRVPVGTPPEVYAAQLGLIRAQVGEMHASIAGLEAARNSALSEAMGAGASIAKLNETLPILDHELDAMHRLDAKGYAPGMRLLELERQRRNEAGDRDVAIAQERRARFDAGRLSQQAGEARQQAMRQALSDLSKAQSDASVKREEVVKAARRAGLERLLAPVDGTVQQLAVHTVGGVVEPAKSLMTIVPVNTEIEVEAKLLNKDSGFVREGQRVTVKIDAFPFTRYGTVSGRVVSISRDAVPDQKLGATYQTTIRLDRNSIMVDGKPVPLTSGLGVVADVRTGSRRIISWLLSPIQTTVSQAGRER